MVTGREVIENALKEAEKGDWSASPIDMDPEESRAYQRGLAAAYQHALEVMPADLAVDRDAVLEEAAMFRWMRDRDAWVAHERGTDSYMACIPLCRGYDFGPEAASYEEAVRTAMKECP
jgi:hypothetical protein